MTRLTSEAVQTSFAIAMDAGALWRFARQVVGAVLLCCAGAVLFHALRTPQYSSSVRFVVDHRNLQLTADSSVLVNSALTGSDVDSQVEILRSGNVADLAFGFISPLGVDDFLPKPTFLSRFREYVAPTKKPSQDDLRRIALGEFQKRINVKRVGDTFAIDVTATFRTPEGAELMAGAVARAYLEEQARNASEIMGATSAWLRSRIKATGVNARIISNAVHPLAPNGPSLLMLLAAAVIGGSTLGFALAILREYLDQRIVTPQQASRMFEADYLGQLPSFANPPEPDTRISLEPAFADVSSEGALPLHTLCVASALGSSGPRIVGVTSAEAESGTTTVALNLSRIAASSGLRVLLVDCGRGSATLTRMLASDSRAGLQEVLSGKVSVKDAVWHDTSTSYHLLSQMPDSPSQTVAWRWARIRSQLPSWQAEYDLTVFDLPPLTDTATAMAANAVLDGIVYVLRPGEVRVQGAERLLEPLKHGRQPLQRSVLFNKARFRPRSSTQASLKHSRSSQEREAVVP
jgi:Mrp family chromosome partitioning ATPase